MKKIRMAGATPRSQVKNGATAKQPNDIVILEHLHDLVCSAGDDIMMECEIDAPLDVHVVWYKNDRALRNNSRCSILTYKNIHRLEIKNAHDNDQGVYCLIAKYGELYVMSKAFVFVPLVMTNEVAYYSINPNECTRITRHLCPVTVKPGEKIELLLLMDTYVHVKHYWYKDDVEMSPTNRIKITNTDDTAHLEIIDAIPDDAGIYVLVMMTRDGVLSSYAGVNVLNDINTDKLTKPSIIHPLLPKVTATENQYMKIYCRGLYDINTRVDWYMNDLLINDIQVLQEDFGNGLAGLKIFDTITELSAKYKVVMTNKKTGQKVSSSCNLTIDRSLMPIAPFTGIVKPLESVVASCGSRVVLDCVFSYENLQKLRAIWYVGRYKVERSNRLFSVICKGGTFILHIKKMSIDMAGEVVCEIHQWVHNPNVVHISQSIANLTMVPPGFLDDSLGDLNPKHFRKGCHYRNRPLPPEEPAGPTPYIRQILMMRPIKFKFCLLDKSGHYYLFTKPRIDVQLYYNHPTRTAPRNMRDIGIFQWDNGCAPGAWYSVAFQTDEGAFVEIGITRRPVLKIQVPPVEQMVIFQIRPIPPVACMYRPMVCFRRDQELELKVPPQRRVRDYSKFSQIYINCDEVIGGGAYGRVSLIEDEYGDSMAAKVVRLHPRNKLDTALREFFMLRRLLHHNVVSVADAFANREQVVIVLDYACGGELFDRIVRDVHINEADIAPCVKQILSGLHYIHSQNVVHLDLKPENMMFAHPNSLTVKLVDFGLSKVLFDGSKIKSVYGTRDYVAPEVLKSEPINLNSDMWSLGVVVFLMLSGSLPFDANSEPDQTTMIITANYNYDDPAFRTISESAKNFIDHLLVPQPRRRFKAEEALKHPWIVCGPPVGCTSGEMKITRKRLKLFLEISRAKWKRDQGIYEALSTFDL